jgi:hypothetical protein
MASDFGGASDSVMASDSVAVSGVRAGVAVAGDWDGDLAGDGGDGIPSGLGLIGIARGWVMTTIRIFTRIPRQTTSQVRPAA